MMNLANSHQSGNTLRPSVYKLFPLDYTKEEIRLVKISPGQGSEPVQLEIFIADLNDQPVFKALSYAWSGDGVDVEIQIGGEPFIVSQTLHHALLQLREPTEESILWIDAICINQRSTEEKNHQVPLMCNIYSSAQEVIIWLGETSQDMDTAMKFLKHVDTTIGPQRTHEELRLAQKYLDEQAEARDSFDIGLITLFERPWFKRTWILQEAALPPREPKFLYGSHWISWNKLVSVKSLLHNWFCHLSFEVKCEVHTPTIHRHALHASFHRWPFDELSLLRHSIQDMRPCGPPLEYFMFTTKRALASDPRDRIYGLLGLTCPRHDLKVEVNYSKPVAEVFRDAMITMIKGKERLLCLAFKEMESLDCRCLDHECSCDLEPSKVSGGSWIPDFGKSFNPASQFFFAGLFTPFNADSGVSPTLKVEGFSLTARGLLLDIVKYSETTSKPGAMSWSRLLPLVKLFWEYARVSSHEEDQFQDGGGCPACLAQRSHIESVLALAHQFSRDLQRPCSPSDGFEQLGTPSKTESDGLETTEIDEADCNLPRKFEPMVEGCNQKFKNEDLDLEAIDSLPRILRQPASEFHKCGSYKTPTGSQSTFWEAAWRTLAADNHKGFLSKGPNSAEADKFCFALHWESVVEQSNTLQIPGWESSTNNSTRFSDQSNPTETTISKALRYILEYKGVLNAIEEVQKLNMHTLFSRKVFVTKNGWMGLGPSILQPGDVLVILFGGKVPYALRPSEDHYIFVGECYVHGIMDGELVTQFFGAAVNGMDEEDEPCWSNNPFVLRDFEIR